MSNIFLSLSLPETGKLKLLAISADQKIEQDIVVGTLIQDLVKQNQSLRATIDVQKELALELGKILLDGQILDIVRQKIQHTDQLISNQILCTLFLLLDENLFAWPWECALDPQSEISLCKKGIEFVRLIPNMKMLAANELPRTRWNHEGLLVAPTSENVRLHALKAATRNLKLKANLEINTAQNIVELTNQAQKGLSFVHLCNVDQRGQLRFDDEYFVGEWAFAKEIYWLVLGDFCPDAQVLEAHKFGAKMVLSRQIPLSAQENSIVDRALYLSLSNGKTPIEALRDTRLALYENDPISDHWASIRLSCLLPSYQNPSHPNLILLAQNEAFAKFPPPNLPVLNSIQTHTPTPQLPIPLSSTPLQFPSIAQYYQSSAQFQSQLQQIQAPYQSIELVGEFIQATLKLIHQSQKEDVSLEEKAKLNRRTPVMKQLSSIVKAKNIQPKEGMLKSAQVATQLQEASLFEDQPLAFNQQLTVMAEQMAVAMALEPSSVIEATKALMVSPILWICGSDQRTRELFARELVQNLYGYYPCESQQAPMTHDLKHNSTLKGLYENGDFYASIIQNWSPEDVAIDQPLRERSKNRHHVVAYQSQHDQWKLLKGIWLICQQPSNLSDLQRKEISKALLDGLWTFQAQGQKLHLHIPKDFRVIYLSDHPPATQLEAEAVVDLQPNVLYESLVFLQETKKRLLLSGLGESLADQMIQSPQAQSYADGLCLLHRFVQFSQSQAINALVYALRFNDYQQATRLYLKGVVSRLSSEERQCVELYAQADVISFVQAWNALVAQGIEPKLPTYALSWMI
jgi:hypothetical protein